MKIAVLGAGGRMGRRVVGQVLDHADATLVAAVVHGESTALGVDAAVLAGRDPCGVVVTPVALGFGDAEVVIDFSLPAGTLAALPHLGTAALVTGTTGLDPEQVARVEAHGSHGALLRAANFSTGVNVLLALVAQAARALPGYDLEIVEAHHGRKIDAPSGTALALASAGAEARGVDLEGVREDGRVGRTGPREHGAIGLHAIRGGSITGHHEVWLAGMGEHLKLVHTAESRDTFAAGALRAALWVGPRAPGIYTMAEVLGLSAMVRDHRPSESG